MSFQSEKKGRTHEAICTCLGRWDSPFDVHPKPNSTKIGHVTRDQLGGKVIVYSPCITKKLPNT
mgnify:FL=1